MIELVFALFLIAALQGYNWSVNTRVQAEYEVLKQRMERMEKGLANNGR